MIKLNSIEFSKKKVISYNRTHQSFRKVFYPKNYDELKNILKFFRKANKKILIKSGECGHGDKTNLETSELVVSLTKINKIKSINKKKLILKAQSGINLYNLFNILKRKNLTLFNIPGGKNVSLGPNVSIGSNCNIQNCSIENSIIMNDCKISGPIEISKSIIPYNSNIVKKMKSSFLICENSKIEL